jgi:DNA-binding NarL/FixJ family response regulator
MLREALAEMLMNIGFEVVLQAKNGLEMIEKLKYEQPEIILMDLSMPEMDGAESTQWIMQNKPEINVLALSMNEDETSVIKMIRAGARGYILKDQALEQLEYAIFEVQEKGYYFSDIVNGKIVSGVLTEKIIPEPEPEIELKPREIEFLTHCCSELNYRQIGQKMNLSLRTVDGYRESLFRKFNVKTRTGLVLSALKNGIIEL